MTRPTTNYLYMHLHHQCIEAFRIIDAVHVGHVEGLHPRDEPFGGPIPTAGAGYMALFNYFYRLLKVPADY